MAECRLIINVNSIDVLDHVYAHGNPGERTCMFHAGKNSNVSRIFVLYHGPHSLLDHRQDRKIDSPWQNPDEYPDVSG